MTYKVPNFILSSEINEYQKQIKVISITSEMTRKGELVALLCLPNVL